MLSFFYLSIDFRGTNPAAQSSARLPCEDGQNGVCSASDVSSGSEDGGVDNSERKVREAIPPSGTPRRHRHDVKRVSFLVIGLAGYGNLLLM